MEVVDLCTPPPSPKEPVESTEVESGAAASSLGKGPASVNSDADSDLSDDDTSEKVARCRPVEKDDDDDDFEMQLGKGDFANIDFAHSREHCGVKAFGRGKNAESCPNCFCYICDKPVKECSEWFQHCHASSASAADKALRLKYRTGVALTLNDMNPSGVLSQLVRVHPHECAGKLAVPLRVYQRQSLAWMCENEANGVDMQPLVGSFRPRVFGGILSDTMGMGKTVTVCALILERPVSLTTIVVPKYLVKQWQRFLNKFAPTLRVVTFYGNAQTSIDPAAYDVVVVNAGSKLAASVCVATKRLVVDESHILLRRPRSVNGEAMKFLVKSHEYPGIRHRWLITGTPFVSPSDSIVKEQLEFLTGTPESLARGVATVNALRTLIMRHTFEQRLTRADGSSDVAMQAPTLKKRTLSCELGEKEKRIYEIAECFDALKGSPTRREELEGAVELRRLVADGKLIEFNAKFNERLETVRLSHFDPRSHAVTLANLQAEVSSLCRTVTSGQARLEAIVEDIRNGFERYPRFKAIIVVDLDRQAEFIVSRIGSERRVTFIPDMKGKIQLRALKAIDEFQAGNVDVLVCHQKIAEQGVSLEQACAIYFVRLSVDTTCYEQSCGRIRREGSVHEEVDAVQVVVKNTVYELISKYHTQSDKDDLSLFRTSSSHDFGEEQPSRHVFFGPPMREDPRRFSQRPRIVSAGRTAKVFMSECAANIFNVMDLFASSSLSGDIQSAADAIQPATRSFFLEVTPFVAWTGDWNVRVWTQSGLVLDFPSSSQMQPAGNRFRFLVSAETTDAVVDRRVELEVTNVKIYDATTRMYYPLVPYVVTVDTMRRICRCCGFPREQIVERDCIACKPSWVDTLVVESDDAFNPRVRLPYKRSEKPQHHMQVCEDHSTGDIRLFLQGDASADATGQETSGDPPVHLFRNRENLFMQASTSNPYRFVVVPRPKDKEVGDPMTITVNGRVLHTRVLPSPLGETTFRRWVRAAEIDDADDAVSPEPLERRVDEEEGGQGGAQGQCGVNAAASTDEHDDDAKKAAKLAGSVKKRSRQKAGDDDRVDREDFKMVHLKMKWPRVHLKFRRE